MAERRKYLRQNMDGVTDDHFQYTDVIPNGTKWVITKFVCSCERVTGNKGMRFVLKFGNDEIVCAHIIDQTAVIPVEREYVGNGSKRIRMWVENMSSNVREFSFTIDGYEV